MRRPGNNKTYEVFNEATNSTSPVSSGKKRLPPISFRVSAEEREQIIKAAGELPISAYVKLKVLDGRSASVQKVRVDRPAIAQALSKIGQSGLSSNLHQIAKAASIGALPVSPSLEEELHNACNEIIALRKELLKALGLRGAQ